MNYFKGRRVVGALVFCALMTAGSALLAVPFNAVQIEAPDGTVPTTAPDLGLAFGDVAWGDYDNDGDLDALASGQMNPGTANNSQLRIYRNDGGFFTQIDVNALNGGLRNSSVAWGDADNDGDLDILATGRLTGGGANRRVRVFFNNGAAAWTFVEVEATANQGVESGGAAWGDFDNDGDLDVLVSGVDNGGPQVRVYRNNGNRTFDANQIEVNGANNGMQLGGAAFADYNGDGDLDVLAGGVDGGGNAQLRVWRNNGDGTFDANEIDVPNTAGQGANAGLTQGDLAWGDCDADGDPDILVHGLNAGAPWIRVYRKNAGLDTYTLQNVEATANTRLSGGGVAWGDSDNDGDLDILVSGQDGTAAPNLQLRVYRNNGACTNFEVAGALQYEVDGNVLDLGLRDGRVAWGDQNNDGKLDVLASGQDGSGAPNQQVRVYLNAFAGAANAAPPAPTGLASSFAYSAAPAMSTATFQWDPPAGADDTTPLNLLTYDIQISTTAGFTGGFVFPGQLGATPRRGSYQRPQLIAGKHTVYLKSTSPLDPDLAPLGLQGSTTYYFRVRTVDAGLRESGWTTGPSLFTGVPPAAAVLAVAAAGLDGQIVLNWNAPAGAVGGAYDVRWSLAAISSDALFNAATPLTNEPPPAAAGTPQTMNVRGVPPEQPVFFALKTIGAGGTSALSNSPSGNPLAFDRTQIEVSGAANAGLRDGDVAWGDIDGDGLWDIVAMGSDSGGVRRLRVYRNDGTGNFVNPPLDLPFLANGNVALGDFDGDNDLDIGASGNDGTAAPNRQLRVFVNNSTPGTLSFPSSVNVPGAPDQGFDYIGTPAPGGGCGLEWADMNNDGDLDMVVCGTQETTGVAQLYIYFNNGNGTFSAPLDVPTSGDNYYVWGDLAVSDFDHNGQKDIVAMGYTSTGVPPGAARRIAVHYNQGGNPPAFTEAILAGEELSSGALAVGDANNDGWADLVFEGFNGARQLRFCRNNNGLFDTGAFPCTDVEGAANLGLNRGEVAWGDYNNDGNLDVLAQGGDQSVAGDGGEIRLYAGNGNGTFGARVNVENPNGGMVNEGAVGWGDFDNDGDSDLVVTGSDQYGAGGNPQLRVYVNHWNATPGGANNPPSAPATLVTDFTFSATGASTATFKWNPATDDITPPAGLKYQIQAATTTPAYSSPLAVNTPSPQYFPQIYDGNTRHGTVLVSTNPWDPQSGTLTGLVTDTTYYFHVKTIDAGFMASGWSGDQTLWTGVAPAASAISVGSSVPGLATMTWTSAGDDQTMGNLTGNYRVLYSTNPAAVWSPMAPSIDVATVTIATTGVVPGALQSAAFAGLPEGVPLYFRLFSQDDVGLWSAVSNPSTATIAVTSRNVDVVESEYQLGNFNLGLSTGTTVAITVNYTGNVSGTLRLYASTATVGTPWSLGATPSDDVAVVYGAFHGAPPALASFAADDVLTLTPRVCTAADVSIDGTQTGAGLAPGDSRSLWFRLDMPTTSSTLPEQQIQITVEAGP